MLSVFCVVLIVGCGKKKDLSKQLSYLPIQIESSLRYDSVNGYVKRICELNNTRGDLKEGEYTIAFKYDVVDYYDKVLATCYGRAAYDAYLSIGLKEDKYAISLDSIVISGKGVDIDTCKYNATRFMSNKKPFKTSVSTAKKTESRKIMTLKEYATELYDSGMHNVSITDDGLLIYKINYEITGDCNYQAESIYNEARGAGVHDIRGVRVVKMPDNTVVGRYIKRK